ncbi:unnamed protein product [Paramecium sonneborni]|uniref:Uncharacterized protein n=1 Tax=Paramecium sonneborni TaxID=65129 RepID=A0A8S1R1S7_9CILI|nr:unnamed protein product [Paramecium sonneborni]
MMNIKVFKLNFQRETKLRIFLVELKRHKKSNLYLKQFNIDQSQF